MLIGGCFSGLGICVQWLRLYLLHQASKGWKQMSRV